MLVQLIFFAAAAYCFYSVYERNNWKVADMDRRSDLQPNRFSMDYSSDFSNGLDATLPLHLLGEQQHR